MAINLPNFRQLTAADMGAFDLPSALQKGFQNFNTFQEARYKPKNLEEELLAKQLTNKIQGINAQYAEPLKKLEIQTNQENLAMNPLRMKLIEAQINKANRPTVIPGKLSNLYRLRDSLPVNSPDREQVEQAIQATIKGSQDRPTVIPGKLSNLYRLRDSLPVNSPDREQVEQAIQATIKGSQDRPTVIPGKLSNLYRLRDSLPVNSPDREQVEQAIQATIKGSQGITMFDPTTGEPMVQIGGSGQNSNKGQGGQLYQTNKGNIYQKPTGPILTQLQNRITGNELVAPYIEKAIETLPQFQSGWTQLKNYAEGQSNKWLGTNFDLPSQLAEGKSSLGLAAEGMIRQFGLNATGHNLKRMEQILTPSEGEAIEGYKNRAQRQLIEFLVQSLKAKKFAGRGVPILEKKENAVNSNNKKNKSNYSQAEINAAKAELERRRMINK